MQYVNILILKFGHNLQLKVGFLCIKEFTRMNIIRKEGLYRISISKLRNMAEYIHTMCQRHDFA